MTQNEITLKVAESLSQREIGQGIARIDPNVMSELGLKEKDIIEINGDKKTAAIVLPSQTEIGINVIRIDAMKDSVGITYSAGYDEDSFISSKRLLKA